MGVCRRSASRGPTERSESRDVTDGGFVHTEGGSHDKNEGTETSVIDKIRVPTRMNGVPIYG